MTTRILLVIVALVLVGCGSTGHQQMQRQETLERWEALVRWSEYDALIDMIHPEWLAENPIHPVDVDRLHQFRVTEYRVRQVMVDPDGDGLERLVQIRMYHLHSARERVIDHREVWRHDEEVDRWLLHSGLPDPRMR